MTHTKEDVEEAERRFPESVPGYMARRQTFLEGIAHARASVVPMEEWLKKAREHAESEGDNGNAEISYRIACMEVAAPLARENAELKERLAVAEGSISRFIESGIVLEHAADCYCQSYPFGGCTCNLRGLLNGLREALASLSEKPGEGRGK